MPDSIKKNDSKFLSVIQDEFPIIERPFRAIAEYIGWTEKEVISAIESLMDEDIIRTFGPVFDPKKLGYTNTLVAASVEQSHIAELSTAILDIREITHNYQRDHELNMWFTITAHDNEIMDSIIKRVEKFPGVKKVLNLPVTKIFKIRAVFGVDRKVVSPETILSDTRSTKPMNDSEKNIVRILNEGFPLVERPFQVIAGSLDTGQTTIIETVARWVKEGVIRRFGARLNHRNAGYKVNTLLAWNGSDVDTWGRKFAGLSAVTHCYKRQNHDEWPYKLYAMVHARTEGEMDNIVRTMKSMAPGAEMIFLKTLKELKKTSMKYFLED